MKVSVKKCDGVNTFLIRKQNLLLMWGDGWRMLIYGKWDEVIISTKKKKKKGLTGTHQRWGSVEPSVTRAKQKHHYYTQQWHQCFISDMDEAFRYTHHAFIGLFAEYRISNDSRHFDGFAQCLCLITFAQLKWNLSAGWELKRYFPFYLFLWIWCSTMRPYMPQQRALLLDHL